MIMQILIPSSSDIHESDSNISISFSYNEISNSQHVHNSIISLCVPQVIDEVNASVYTHEISLAVDTQTNLCLSIQHAQLVHVCDIEMGAAVNL